jgi:hypothetical protein
MQYQTFRSVSDIHLYVLCRDGEFEQLPEYILKQGPWHVMRRGDILNLRRTYRLRLARYGFVLEHSKLAVFNPRGVKHTCAR